MKKSIALGLILSFFSTIYANAYVCINEIMAKNTSYPEFSDCFGEQSDWIEFYNSSDEVINLENYYLSDDVNEPLLWQFPAVNINPKSFLIVYASGKDTYENGELHTNFKISKDETIVLTKPDKITTVDIVSLPNLEDDCTYHRRFDGEGPFEKSSIPSFNLTNRLGGLRINVFGNYITSDVPAKVIDGNTLLPIRFVFDALGAYVKWDGDTNTIYGYYEDINLKLQVGNHKAYVNDKEYILPTPPINFDGRVLVPVRFIAESFNLKVDYDETNRTVFIRR